MRGLGSVTFVVLVGCASTTKPPAPAAGSAVRQAPSALSASPPDPSPPDPSSPDTTPTESPTPSTSVPPPAPGPPPKATDPRPTAAETRACTARGGTIQPICMSGELTCVVRYRDGGKRCSDKRDCTGQCLYEGPDPPPPKATGTCQRTSDPCGCKAPIHHGQVEPALCAD